MVVAVQIVSGVNGRMVPTSGGVRVECVRLGHQGHAALPVTHAGEHAAKRRLELGVIRSKRQGLVCFTLEQVELLGEEISHCGDHPCSRIVWVKLHRLGRLCDDVLRRHWRGVDSENPAYETQPGQLTTCLRVCRVERDGLLQRLSCRAELFTGPIPLYGCACAQYEIVGPDLLGALPRCHIGLVALDCTIGAGNLTDDLTNDLVLDEEAVGYLAIDPIGPNMGTGLGIYKLRRDAADVCVALDTGLE